MFGGTPGEVARSIIVDWLKNNIGWDKIEEIGAMNGFDHIKTKVRHGKK